MGHSNMVMYVIWVNNLNTQEQPFSVRLPESKKDNYINNLPDNYQVLAIIPLIY